MFSDRYLIEQRGHVHLSNALRHVLTLADAEFVNPLERHSTTAADHRGTVAAHQRIGRRGIAPRAIVFAHLLIIHNVSSNLHC